LRTTFSVSEDESDNTKRDIYDSAERQPLPYTRQTAKFYLDERYDWCFDTYHVTAVVTDANGQNTTFTGEDELVVDVPAEKPAQVRFTYEEDPYFEAVFTYHHNIYAYAKGSSSKSES
jgi:hypothetical protein